MTPADLTEDNEQPAPHSSLTSLLLPYRKQDKWGFCTADKIIVIPCEYEKAWEFTGDTAIVQYNGKYGAVNRAGKLY